MQTLLTTPHADESEPTQHRLVAPIIDWGAPLAYIAGVMVAATSPVPDIALEVALLLTPLLVSLTLKVATGRTLGHWIESRIYNDAAPQIVPHTLDEGHALCTDMGLAMAALESTSATRSAAKAKPAYEAPPGNGGCYVCGHHAPAGV